MWLFLVGKKRVRCVWAVLPHSYLPVPSQPIPGWHWHSPRAVPPPCFCSFRCDLHGEDCSKAASNAHRDCQVHFRSQINERHFFRVLLHVWELKILFIWRGKLLVGNCSKSFFSFWSMYLESNPCFFLYCCF